MQLTSGEPSDQAKFEYVIVNDDGKVIFQKTSDYSTLIEEYKAQQGGKQCDVLSGEFYTSRKVRASHLTDQTQMV